MTGFNANGNMTKGYDYTDPANVAERTFTYNAENMPTRIEHSVHGISQIMYDGDGTRAKKIYGSKTVFYIGGHYQVTNGVATRYIFAGNTRIAMQCDLDPIAFANSVSPKVYYFHKDHLGSSTVITDEAGAVVEKISYLPYGGEREAWRGENAPDNNYKYTDQEHDPESGLYNYNARLYDPWTGQFITPDTIVPDFSDPQTLNRYAYCRGNPMIYVDPSGHWFQIAFFAFIGGSAGAIIGGGSLEQVLTIGVTSAAAAGVGSAVGSYVGGQVTYAGIAGGVGPPTTAMVTAGQVCGAIAGGFRGQ